MKRSRERVFTEDLLVEQSGSADPNLPVLARVSSLMEVLQLGGSYKLVERLWRPVHADCQSSGRSGCLVTVQSAV